MITERMQQLAGNQVNESSFRERVPLEDRLNGVIGEFLSQAGSILKAYGVKTSSPKSGKMTFSDKDFNGTIKITTDTIKVDSKRSGAWLIKSFPLKSTPVDVTMHIIQKLI